MRLLLTIFLFISFSAESQKIFSKKTVVSICPTGIVSRWLFQEGTGTTATDACGSHNGTLQNSPTRHAGYIVFNGTTQSIEIDGTSDVQGTLSYGAWVKLNTYNTGEGLCTIFGIYGSSGYHSVFYIDDVGKLHMNLYNSDASAYIGRLSSTTVSTGSWHYVTATWSGGTAATSIKLYLDGSQIDNSSISGGTFTGVDNVTTPLWLAAVYHNGEGLFFMDGALNDPRIYNIELSSGTITDIYNAGNVFQ